MRLTKEDRYGHFYTNKANCRNIWSLDGKKLEGVFFENQTLAIDGDAINKLGQLEDIEDEIGIDLITLFKALKNGVYIPYYRQIISLERYKLDFPNKRFIAKYFNGNEWEETLYFKDYGRTWALTKEELK